MSESVDTRQIHAYGVNMPTTPPDPRPLRLRIIDPVAIQHVMEHPARGRHWTVRELAPVLGCSIGTLGHMRTGARATVPTELAERFAEAVGVEVPVLFVPVVSTNSDTTEVVA